MRIIDNSALINNYKTLKNKSGKKICAMVKADAYGHGIKNVCFALKDYADYFGVATISEAIKIRSFGVKNNIVVVGKVDADDIIVASKNNIDVSVFSFEELQLFNNICETKRIQINVHIKINSGMNRLGVKTIYEFNLMQKLIKNNKNINFCGIFTHFCAIFDNYYFEKQQNLFNLFIKSIDKNFNPIIHLGGGYIFDQKTICDFDMLRCGLILYGYGNNEVKKVLKIKSKVLQISDVLPYEMTGYSPCLITPYPRRVATIFYGYADGFPKSLSNNVNVIIEGKICKIVGVCMDMIICDVSNIETKVGDEVVVFDDAEKWLKATNLSVYEILVGFRKLR